MIQQISCAHYSDLIQMICFLIWVLVYRYVHFVKIIQTIYTYDLHFSLHVKFYFKSLLSKAKQNINTSKCPFLKASPSSTPRCNK